MQVKSYKEYRKEVNKIIKENKDIDNCRNELRNYYSNEHIFKENLIKRYNHIDCNQKNLAPYFTGIASGLISGLLCAAITTDSGNDNEYIAKLIIFILIMIFLCPFIYNYFVKYINTGDDEVYIYPYEKLLIEEYLKEKYHFEVNPTDFENSQSNKKV